MLLALASIRVLLLLTPAKSPGRAGFLDPFDEADSCDKVDMDPWCVHDEAEGSSSSDETDIAKDPSSEI